MPTKFPRRKCITCGAKHVVWKMPSATNEFGENRIFFCWKCAGLLAKKLALFDLENPPIKKTQLGIAKQLAIKIPMKIKQETF